MQHLLSTLSLCRHAGFLVIGFDPVKEAMQSGTAQVVLLAQDLSPKTKKEAVYFATKYARRIVEIDQTIDAMATVIGKKAGVVAITNPGLAQKFYQNFEDLKQ